MNRRAFSRNLMIFGAAGTPAGAAPAPEWYEEPARKLPVRQCDVVVAGGGTAGVAAAIAAARQGARTVLIESKGYPGGTVVEGGTALHSFFNLWKAFPGVAKRQIVRGIPQQIVDRLVQAGGTSGHAEMSKGYDYDSVCTAIDTEVYKLVVFEMLAEAGVTILVNTLLAGAIRESGRLEGVIAQSRSGREAIMARSFVDSTGYGDLAAYAGARYTEPNDHPVCNSMGLAGVDIEKYHAFLESNKALVDRAEGVRSGREGRIVRMNGTPVPLPPEFREGAKANGMSLTMTSTRDNYFMFIKVNYKMPASPTSRDEVAKAELELRRRQARSVALFRKFVPGCENAFIARTSPSLNIRRGRRIECDYDITRADVLEARRFDDEVMIYGFHDSAPRLKIAGGGWYGVPYRALCVAGVENLYATGMMITSNFDAHMSTRNTICSMGQGQAAGTAAAMCAALKRGARELPYGDLRKALVAGGVVL
jgi:hypothetical protein